MLTYVAPIYRNMSLPTLMVTDSFVYIIGSGIAAGNGLLININWNAFVGATPFMNLFRFFEVASYQATFTLSTTTAAEDSFNQGTIAFLPQNYLIESSLVTTPTDSRPIATLPGAIAVQPGASNKGQWYRQPYKQTFSTTNAFSTTTPRVCGALIGYFDDLGISETIGFITVKANFKFMERAFYQP